MSRISWKLVNWSTSSFLIGTLLLTLTAVPAYIWRYGLDAFQTGLFLVLFISTGLSITLGYHRLFSHRSFHAAWPVRLFTLLFGAAAFENSALRWAADHRRHHKHVDHDEDPYDISKGFFHAHIGWILFRYQEDTPLDVVKDLQDDKLVQWQHRHYYAIAGVISFLLPTLLGWIWGGPQGALGSFLIAGVARVVFVHHMTFFINSLCHTLGGQPYSSRCSARDSSIMALFTFGEGYHNFHHAFQHDYRNGVRAWQWDPTKWTIWVLHVLGLVRELRRVPEERILLAQIAEQERQLAARLESRPLAITEPIRTRLQAAQARLQEAFQHWEELEVQYRRTVERKLEASREKFAELRHDFSEARTRFQAAIRDWQEAHQLALAQFA
jgi:stearoyl-CoA desaturase (Delta-9 desaturase)